MCVLDQLSLDVGARKATLRHTGALAYYLHPLPIPKTRSGLVAASDPGHPNSLHP
jgi:hypothetical protein